MRNKSRVRYHCGPALVAYIGCWLCLFSILWLTPSSVKAQSGLSSVAPASSSDGSPVSPDPAVVPPGTTRAAADDEPPQPVTEPYVEDIADTDPSALTVFRPHLDPHGTWVNDPRYGLIWVPDPTTAGADFVPYVSRGHWELDTNDDWVWVSDYPFGWVVFHYGRWIYVEGRGWSWVPGRRYAPSWVVWRVPQPGFAYVGWAPMPPSYGWFSAGLVVYTTPGTAIYVFCPTRHVFHRHVAWHLVRDRQVIPRLAARTERHGPSYGSVTRRPALGKRPAGPSPARLGVARSVVPPRRMPARPENRRLSALPSSRASGESAGSKGGVERGAIRATPRAAPSASKLNSAAKPDRRVPSRPARQGGIPKSESSTAVPKERGGSYPSERRVNASGGSTSPPGASKAPYGSPPQPVSPRKPARPHRPRPR